MARYLPPHLQKQVTQKVESVISNISKDFSIDTISKSPARFNLKKLQWFNQQYIQALSLDEFISRASWHKLYIQNTQAEEFLKAYENEKLREGVYVIMYHETSNTIVAKDMRNEWALDTVLDSPYMYPGGGIEEGESIFKCLEREVLEEVGIKIDIRKCIFLSEIKQISDSSYTSNGIQYHGKADKVYVYKLDDDEYRFISNNPDKGEGFGLIPCGDILSISKLFSYWVLKDCIEDTHSKTSLVSSHIPTQYLAYKLDKNRATLLTDLGKESECILHYQNPSREDIKWRKNTIEESLETLTHLKSHCIENTAWWQGAISHSLSLADSKHSFSPQDNMNIEALDSQYSQLCINLFKEHTLESFYEHMVEYMDTNIKEYLTSNELDFGLYLWPARIALSGKRKSPSMFEIMPILGISESVKRVSQF